MSKSEWKELPEWSSATAYAFMETASLHVWAWEFLRRNPAYRYDWEQKATNANLTFYDPPILADQTEVQWWRHAAFMQEAPPISMPMNLHNAHKWGLDGLYDPHLPFTQGVNFLAPAQPYPRLLRTPEDLMDMIVDEETDTDLFQHVADQYAIIAFDLTAAMGEQLEKARKLIQDWQHTLKENGRVKIKGNSPKPEKWIRHLQVLDALRLNPSPTHAVIAQHLGGLKNKNAEKDELFKEGNKYVLAARKMMDSDYRKLLMLKSPPLTNMA